MAGPNDWQARRVPVAFVSMMPFHSSSVVSSVGMRWMRPAQLIKMSTLPNSASTTSRSASTEARLVTSEVTLSERRPRARISAAVAETSASRREVGTTSAPAAAKPSERALPMPDAPPVTTATWPSREKI
jgi:hypothetical protein